MTGIGIKMTSLLIAISHGSQFVLLVITMSMPDIGHGDATAACYIIVSALAAPAVIQMGVNPVAAHFFVFYFGIFSALTPPVALAAFVAAGIADAPFFENRSYFLQIGAICLHTSIYVCV